MGSVTQKPSGAAALRRARLESRGGEHRLASSSCVRKRTSLLGGTAGASTSLQGFAVTQRRRTARSNTE
jgi:hypothetical protein